MILTSRVLSEVLAIENQTNFSLEFLIYEFLKIIISKKNFLGGKFVSLDKNMFCWV